ncbi:MAG: sulfurtransferase-like selenium metabolism protein YedF [Thermodesulfobacteriota bacterium]|nr:sulfurtransferase-like selenium metabolism protein YedF [Thermodesulfobacteriota bacterium]
MDREIDARGLSCPQPVINTKKALEDFVEGIIRVIVDNPIARDNVKRFAESQECKVEIEEKGEEYYIEIVKGRPSQMEKKPEVVTGKEVILIGTNFLGRGDQKLGEMLMGGFLNTLLDSDPKPEKLIFVNYGVMLTTEGSEVIETLALLEERGVKILSCGTCLDYFKLNEKLKVGRTTNMYEIVSSFSGSGKVITL